VAGELNRWVNQIIEELTIKTELSLGELIFGPNDKVTGIRVEEKIYKVFVSNGWWSVDAEHFHPTSRLT
jgi:hypothetical protein